MRSRYNHLPSYKYTDVEGVKPVLEKSAGKPLRDYKVYGESIQAEPPTPDSPQEIECVGDKTKNLFDVFNQTFTSSSDRCATETLENGTLRITNLKVYQYSTAGCWIPYMVSDFVGKTITVSFKTKCSNEDLYAGLVVRFETIDGTSGWNALEKFNYGSSSITISRAITETMAQTYGRIRFNFYTNASATAIGEVGDYVDFENIQLEISDVATEYEPYGKYKIPITVRGKNYADINNPSSSDVLKYDVTNNIIRATCIANTAGSMFLRVGKYSDFVGKTLNLSFDYVDISSNSSGTSLNAYIQADNTSIANKSTAKGVKQSFSFTVPENDNAEYLVIRFYVGYRIDEVDEYITLANIQLEEGTIATEYEPYFEPITNNIFLDEPLRKIGDYSDYIDFKNQRVVRSIGEYEPTGAESWSLYNGADGTRIIYQMYTSNIGLGSVPSTGFYTNITPYGATVETRSNFDLGAYGASNGNSLCFQLRGWSTTLTVDEWKEYLVSNNVKVNYMLATPTEEQIDLPTLETSKYTNIFEIGTALQPSNVIAQYYKKG